MCGQKTRGVLTKKLKSTTEGIEKSKMQIEKILIVTLLQTYEVK